MDTIKVGNGDVCAKCFQEKGHNPTCMYYPYSTGLGKKEDTIFPKVDFPMGASHWKEHGLKYLYWNFFETQIRKDWEDEYISKQKLKEIIKPMFIKDTDKYTWEEGFNSALYLILKEFE